jgi:hypothetical protein
MLGVTDAYPESVKGLPKHFSVFLDSANVGSMRDDGNKLVPVCFLLREAFDLDQSPSGKGEIKILRGWWRGYYGTRPIPGGCQEDL